jgi:peptidoglycan/LPS O-acetylase OafA/YrhL
LRPVKYVPGLDGLRAVAVIAVLAFHAQFSAASGGFLGVSLFFTLSGFLITTLLLDEQATTGTLSLRRFYARRVRRLLPAAYLLLLLVLLASGWWAAGQQRRLPGDLIAAVANVANWRFAFAPTSYQELFLGEPSPVAHFWSLAIEEQIYLILPVVVLVALRRGPRALAITTGALLAGSIASTLLTTDRDLIYNGTHTRAAELLVGVALAQVLRRRPLGAGGSMSWVPGLLAISGFVALVMSASVEQNWIYRGGLVGVSMISAALIAAVAAGRFPARLLAATPLVAIGKVSYGIYLFHWPVFLLVDEAQTGLAPLPLFVVQCLVTGVLTVASYQLIEQPIRRGRLIGRDRVMVPTMLASAGIVAVAAVLVVPTPSLTPTEELLALGEQEVVQFEPPGVRAVDATDITDTNEAARSASPIIESAASPIIDAEPAGPVRLAVLGSAPVAAVAFGSVDDDTEYEFVEDVRPDCSLVSVGVPGCVALEDRWSALRASGDIDALVLVTGSVEVADALAKRGLVATVDELVALGVEEEAMIDALLWTIDDATAAGIPVVWYTQAGADTEFFRHFARIGVERPVVRRVAGGDAELAGTIRDVLRDPNRGDAAVGDLRVLVIGDSTSLNFARALYDGSDADLNVLWAGANGCPFAELEATRGSSGDQWAEADCVAWHDKVPPLLDSFDPDVLFVMTGPMELVEHRFVGDPTGRTADDPVFAAARNTELDALLAVVPADLPVLVADLPVITIGGFSSREMTLPERLAGINDQIVEWDERFAQLARFPYRDTLEAAERERPLDDQIRYDGTHPKVEPLTELARETYVPVLVAMVAQLRAELAAAAVDG